MDGKLEKHVAIEERTSQATEVLASDVAAQSFYPQPG